MKGRFIVLEGIDGCGKTTQINHLKTWLPQSGLMPPNANLHITREPGGTNLGKQLRELLLHPPKEESPKPITELLLYAADRSQHVSELILPYLNKGDWVISDRFSGSTICYQGYGRRLSLEIINQLEEIATQGVVPDITFLLDLPITISLQRRSHRNNDRIESEGIEFLTRVSQGFQVLSLQENWIRIPAEEKLDLVTQRIENELKKLRDKS